MQDEQKTLGRGLSSLIPKKNTDFFRSREQVSPVSYLPKSKSGVSNQILHISPVQIAINPYQPRREFSSDSLNELKNSIREHGILQPLIVTQTMGGKFELIAGERRLRAARELNLKSVPVIVRRAKDLEKLELSLIENIQREDLNPIEKAHAYKQLIDNFHLTQEEAALRLGISRSALGNILRLLQLPDDIQTSLASGKISESQAKLILSLPPGKDQQKIFERAETSELTVKEVEKEIHEIKVKAHNRSIKKDPILQNWENQLQEIFGTKVRISRRGKFGGMVEIEFYADEDLRGIIDKLIK